MTVSRHITTLLENQRLINLSFSYAPGEGELFVSLNGQALRLGNDYTEISINQIFLSSPAKAGEVLEVRLVKVE